MVTPETAPVGTIVTIIYSTQHTVSYMGRSGTVTAWASNGNYVDIRFPAPGADLSIWFIPEDVAMYNPNHCGDALSRIQGV